MWDMVNGCRIFEDDDEGVGEGPEDVPDGGVVMARERSVLAQI